jgi:1-acyl-sn-glycerol-3-phosphate acyltransferase
VNGLAGALARKGLWRAVLTATGGLRVRGASRLPAGPCVIVANHNSHADTAALIAALPARRRPAVAAAADYWFGGGPRGWLPGPGLRSAACQALCGAFPVRRGGGGSADLLGAARLLAAGRDVVIYPEGTRSRDGSIGEFRPGAARLAALAGVPLVPVGITGTRALLPATATGARGRRAAVTVRVGMPVPADAALRVAVESGGTAAAPAAVASDVVARVTAEARAQVSALAVPGGNAAPGERARNDRVGTGRLRENRVRENRAVYLAALAVVFTGGLSAVVAAWS